jgi:hypothetical protein
MQICLYTHTYVEQSKAELFSQVMAVGSNSVAAKSHYLLSFREFQLVAY